MGAHNKITSLKQLFVEFTLADFNDYHIYLEDHSRQILKDFENKIEITISKFKTDEEKEEFKEYCADEYQRLRDDLPHILRRFIFLAIYSFCEKESHNHIDDVPKDHEIYIFKCIRNAIAHHDGKLDKRPGSKKIKEYANKTSDININDHNEIVMEPAFIERVITVFKKYFSDYFQHQESEKTK